MIKIIKNLLYSTESARLVGQFDNRLPINDFNYFSESLYCKKTGEYFLHGEGGANSKYSEWHGNSGIGGQVIRPYTFDDAKEWAVKNLTSDEFSSEFGSPSENAGKVALNLSVTSATKNKLEQMRQETGKSISALIDEILLK